MSEFEGYGEPNKPSVEVRDLSREQAVERGRLLGEQEAESRREVGSDREQRIARAMAYAAWDYDGRPPSSQSQRDEFGVSGPIATGSLDRALTKRLVSEK